MGDGLRSRGRGAGIVQPADAFAVGAVFKTHLSVGLCGQDGRYRIVGGPGQALVRARTIEGTDQIAIGVVAIAAIDVALQDLTPSLV